MSCRRRIHIGPLSRWLSCRLSFWTRGTVLATVMLPLVAGSAGLPPEAEPWLKKMLTARAELSYEGQMVYTHGDIIATLGVVRRIGPNGVEERLFALDGVPREVIRNAEKLACDLQRGQHLEMSRSNSAGEKTRLLSRLDELADYYRVEVKGPQRIASRETRRIDLMPIGNYRHGHRLWLDVDTGLPLKTQLVDADNRVLEQVMFTAITYLDASPRPTSEPGSEPSSEPSPDVAADLADGDANADTGADANADQVEAALTPRWRVEGLPRGFRLSSDRRLEQGGDSVEHLVYSDGLATVSVFIEDLDGNTGFTGVSHQGTVTLYGLIHSGHQVTVIGEVPELTLRDIGNGLRSIDSDQ